MAVNYKKNFGKPIPLNQNGGFDKNELAEKFYPLGKTKQVVIDPKHQFGQPTIKGTNIFPKTIFNLYQSKESKKFIAQSYEISIQEVNDAIEYCKTVA